MSKLENGCHVRAIADLSQHTFPIPEQPHHTSAKHHLNGESRTASKLPHDSILPGLHVLPIPKLCEYTINPPRNEMHVN